MQYAFSFDPSRLQLDRIHAMLDTSYWFAGVRREVIEQAVANSFVLGVYEQSTGAQVGVARIVTDFASFAWICDVFVDPAHRGRGLSKRMMSEILSCPRFATIRRFCLATRDAHTLYERFGFVHVPSGNWYELRLPESNWMRPAVISAPQT